MTDPYVYPETDVLKNKEDIRDDEELEIFERAITANRMENLPRDVPLTYDGYKAIHEHIFERVYEWAGEERTINIAKGDSDFCKTEFISWEMEKRFEALENQNGLRDLTAEHFVAGAAEHICEINAVHPFREGNGRTQQAFLEILADQAGHPIDLARVDRDAWIEASIISFHKGDYEPMREVIADLLVEHENLHEQAHGVEGTTGQLLGEVERVVGAVADAVVDAVGWGAKFLSGEGKPNPELMNSDQLAAYTAELKAQAAAAEANRPTVSELERREGIETNRKTEEADKREELIAAFYATPNRTPHQESGSGKGTGKSQGGGAGR